MIEIVIVLLVCIIAIIVVCKCPEFGPVFAGAFTAAAIGISVTSVVYNDIKAKKERFLPVTAEKSAETPITGAAVTAETATPAAPVIPPAQMYDDNYAKWDSYRFLPDNVQSGLPIVYGDCSEAAADANTGVAKMSRARARDKRCMDGLVTKDANFYKYHFAMELDEVEKKPWW